MNASVPPTNDRYHLKIKEADERHGWFLSSRGGCHRLRVHAIEFSTLTTAQAAADQIEFQAGVTGDIKVVDLKGKTVYERTTVKPESSTPSMNDLLQISARDGDPVIIRDADLTMWAAFEAAQVLAQNWSAALVTAPLAELTGDVDTVMALLTHWRAAVIAKYGSPQV